MAEVRTHSGWPVLTVWQPYAGLIAAGLKRWEFRSWVVTSLWGHRIAIHAAQRDPTYADYGQLGARLGTVKRRWLTGCPDHRAAQEWMLAHPVGHALPMGRVVATARLAGAVPGATLAPAGEEPRRWVSWAWDLRDVRPAISPPLRGRQRIWWVAPADIQEVT